MCWIPAHGSRSTSPLHPIYEECRGGPKSTEARASWADLPANADFNMCAASRVDPLPRRGCCRPRQSGKIRFLVTDPFADDLYRPGPCGALAPDEKDTTMAAWVIKHEKPLPLVISSGRLPL